MGQGYSMRLKHKSKLHEVLASFLNITDLGVLCFDPGQRNCVLLH